MSKSNVLVNNPFLEEADDKFREVFFGSKSQETSSTQVSESIPSPVQKAPIKEELSSNESVSSPSENVGKPIIKTNLVENDSSIKKLERHNFKIYNTQINRLKSVAKHIKSVRGDEVKADMSSVLRYLIDSIDIDHMSNNFPKRY